MHVKNYTAGKTTNQRFAKKASASMTSSMSNSDSIVVSHDKESMIESSRANSVVIDDDDDYDNCNYLCFKLILIYSIYRK